MPRLRLFLLLCSLVPLCAVAQTGGDQPPVAFGSGRAVQGTVTAVTPDRITVKTQAGEQYGVVVSANTQVRKDRQPATLAEVHVGDGVGAMGEIDRPNHTVHALLLFVVDADQIRKARENLGKTFIAGKVTALDPDNLRLTILRSDGVTQTIAVDEGTSFRRGGRGMAQALGMGGDGGMGGGSRAGKGAPAGQAAGESITLADIKAGDVVGGPGALKNGVFVPAELSVATPGVHRARHREGASDPEASPEPQGKP